MFGHKKAPVTETTNEPVVAAIHVIPTDFYGGTNPVVTFKDVTREIELNRGEVVSGADKRLLDKQTAPGSGQALHPANLLANPKFLALAGLGLFLLVGGGVTLYYVVGSKDDAPSAPIVTTIVPPDTVVVETPTTTPLVAPSSTEPVITTPVSLADQPLTFSSTLLGDSGDTDKDGITDREEELFTTDLNVPDTDNDTYSDSHELFYLYNPAGKEPQKLLDSGLVKQYTNPNFGYTLYYPNSWAVGDVDGTYRDVLFSTLTGENIEVRVFDKEVTQDFAEWFAVHAPDQKYSDIQNFETYFGAKGYRREDWLAYYFPTANHVYVLLYHTTDSNIINYRTVLKVLARSFVPGESAAPQSLITPTFTTETTSSIPGVISAPAASTTTQNP